VTTLAELALAGRPLGIPIVDCHAHVGPARGIDRPTSPDSIVRLMDRLGVDRNVISGLMFATGVRVETMNDWVAECLRAHPDRFLGYCYVNPNFPEAMAEEIERCTQAGIDQLLIKPVMVPRLLQVMDSILGAAIPTPVAAG